MGQPAAKQGDQITAIDTHIVLAPAAAEELLDAGTAAVQWTPQRQAQHKRAHKRKICCHARQHGD